MGTAKNPLKPNWLRWKVCSYVLIELLEAPYVICEGSASF